MRVALLRGQAPQPSPVRLPGPVPLPGPRGTAPLPPTTTTTTRGLGSDPAKTSTPQRGQVTPLSSPAAKRLDARPTPTRQRQGAMPAAPISRPGIQISKLISNFLPLALEGTNLPNLWPVL